MKKIYTLFSALLLALIAQMPASAQQLGITKDINPGSADAFPGPFVIINNIVYYSAYNPTDGRELWRSDGTPDGTYMVKDINPGSWGDPFSLVNNNGILYFSADDQVHGRELWKSDGTATGTQMVADINPGTSRGMPGANDFIGVLNGLVLFAGDDGTTGFELWKSDGTAAGTSLLKDINPGKYTSGLGAGMNRYSQPGNYTTANGFVYFTATYDVPGSATGFELWRTDGTTAGTYMVKDIYPGSSGSILKDFYYINGRLYFTAWTNSFTYNFWTSDGTEAGTVQLKDGYNDYGLQFYPTQFGDDVYFTAGEGLFKTNGTVAGTTLITGMPSVNWQPLRLTNVNGTMFFLGKDPEHGYELWKSDGTASGTALLKDLNPGPNSTDYPVLAKGGNKLWFCANDPVHGYEIWTSDGTEAGTQMYQEIGPGTSSALSTRMFAINSRIFIDLKTDAEGQELWSNAALLNSPLPLTLLEFKGSLVNDNGVLQWTTANEINTASFVVERSTDGRHYSPVGTVIANGSGVKNSYDYTDRDIKSLGASMVYYRLRQVDIDNKFDYSRIIALSIDATRNFAMIYPNPVRSDVNLTITLARSERIKWQIVNTNGAIIKSGYKEFASGSTALGIDVRSLQAGNYFMVLEGETIRQVMKVVKQ